MLRISLSVSAIVSERVRSNDTIKQSVRSAMYSDMLYNKLPTHPITREAHTMGMLCDNEGSVNSIVSIYSFNTRQVHDYKRN